MKGGLPSEGWVSTDVWIGNPWIHLISVRKTVRALAHAHEASSPTSEAARQLSPSPSGV